MCVKCLYMVENPYVMFELDGRSVYDVLSRLANMYVLFCTTRYICM